MTNIRQRVEVFRVRIRFRAIGKTRFWARWHLWRRCRFKVLYFKSGIHRSHSQSIEEPRGLVKLMWASAIAGVVALVVFIVLELLASQLSHHRVPGLERYYAEAGFSSFVPYVAASVGALAVFLALFFTTVGVIATTAYSDVPNEVRELFVLGRSNRRYTKTVVSSLVLGTLLLATQVCGYHPHVLTLIVYSLFVLFSVLSLAFLTSDLFRFFDLSLLARQLPRQFERAQRLALVRRKAPPEEVQQLAQIDAGQILAAYRELISVMRSKRRKGVGRAPARMLSDLLNLWQSYSRVKGMIPTDSLWFNRIARHTNWLTADSSRLNLALATQTPIPPNLVPDAVWIEKAIGSFVADLLRILTLNGAWELAVAGTENANNLAAELSAYFQVEESGILHRAVLDGLTDD